MKDKDQKLIFEAYYKLDQSAVEAGKLIEILKKSIDKGGLGYTLDSHKKFPKRRFTIKLKDPWMPDLNIEFYGKENIIQAVTLSWTDAQKNPNQLKWYNEEISYDEISKEIGKIRSKYFKETLSAESTETE